MKTSSAKVLLLAGGWDGHQPEKFAALFAGELRAMGHSVEVRDSLDALDDAAALRGYDMIFPCWTMGQLSPARSAALRDAVQAGTALAGVHGGMGDAFRGDIDYEWMVGGHFVGHPHVGDYTVRIVDAGHAITAGLPTEFVYRSEQYYMLMDPGVQVLADTAYTYEGRTVAMPVAWVKTWGAGRVFYCALGHAPEEFTQYPVALELVRRGLRWALAKN